MNPFFIPAVISAGLSAGEDVRRARAEERYRLGESLEAMGKEDDAVLEYVRAITVLPDMREAHIRLAEIYSRKGAASKARHHRDLAGRAREVRPPAELRPASRPPFKPLPKMRDDLPSVLSGSLQAPAEDAPDPDGDAAALALLPLTGKAIFGRFDGLRDVQRKTIPAVMSGGDVMVISSTASGKTEAVFAPLAEMMLSQKWPGISVLYVSPTRALISDIRQRLDGMLGPLGIRTAQRDGDMKDLDERDPQNVLVTTPESLDTLLCWKRAHIKNVKAVVLDELHMIDGGYRGDQLLVLLRRMRMELGLRFRTFAMTATLSRPEKVAAKYMRSPQLVVGRGGRGLEYHIVPELENAMFWAKRKKASKVLVFCNAPREAERAAVETLSKHYPPQAVCVHHGKLDREERRRSEALLKTGDMAVCACTSTLEVGIDIGDIDLVILNALPRSVSSLAQMIGRSNRRGGVISVVAVGKAGTMVYYEKVFKSVLDGCFEAPSEAFVPSVAVQQMLSCLIPGPRSRDYFHDLFDGLLPPEDVHAIIVWLLASGHLKEQDGRLYAGDACYELGQRVHSNIAGAESVTVVDSATGTPIGQVDMPVDSIFVLSGQAWEVVEQSEGIVTVEKAERTGKIARFASYERKGAFHHLLPAAMREREDAKKSRATA